MSARWTEMDLAQHVAKHPRSLRSNPLSPVPAAQAVKPLKYGNEITESRGIKFRSKKEAQRYEDVLLVEKSGDITELALQPNYPIHVNGQKIGTYRGDF